LKALNVLIVLNLQMRYYSTNKNTPEISLKEAVVKGLAADNGLFMPSHINKFEPSFFEHIQNLTFQEISFEVAKKFFGEDIEESKLKEIVFDTLNFDCPVVKVTNSIYSLELFHGPTLAFKDVGARFMARLLNFFLSDRKEQVNVLVATSGDTGSAVANGFLGVEGIHVFVLYPKGKVSKIQESQFTTLGKNITALEIDGTFDDCQHLVKTAFLDGNLNKKLVLTSANSINVARFLPQAFYYFNAYASLKKQGLLENKSLVFSVPSGNLGNITAGLFAREMGLPVAKFIAANNNNNVVYKYLKTGNYQPQPSVETIANAMDVGAPSNFARILDLYDNSHKTISEIITGSCYSDSQIKEIVKKVFLETGYLCDPHGACGFQALNENLSENQIGVFLETAHPAKFTETVEEIIGNGNVPLPEKLEAFMKGEKKSKLLKNNYKVFKEYLTNEVVLK
jgi:threonine synthase